MEKDIRKKLREDFSLTDLEEVSKLFMSIEKSGSNTGVDQVLRSILFLSNGDLKKVFYYFSMYQLDPRDVVGEAKKLAGNPGHWFSIPFSEMSFKGELPEIENEEDDGLPF